VPTRTSPVMIFGVGALLVQVVPAIVLARTTGDAGVVADWPFLLKASALGAMATTAGYTAVGRKSNIQALCAVPVAAVLVWLVPSDLGAWLSATYRSVAVNVVAAGFLLFLAGAIAAWMAKWLLKYNTRHA